MSVADYPDPDVDAIIARLRSMLPSAEDISAGLGDRKGPGLGPMVAVPAIYLHIITSHYIAAKMSSEIDRDGPKAAVTRAWIGATLTGQSNEPDAA